uniref:Uncharacterized protein n=1 Tax=Arundo donax TaxID=35708 RepID=A0A0A9BJR0_ARUDO
MFFPTCHIMHPYKLNACVTYMRGKPVTITISPFISDQCTYDFTHRAET